MHGESARKMELKNKTALVTGGAVRVGRSTCLALARQGCHVVIHYRTSSDEAEALAKEIMGLGVSAFPLKADLAIQSECSELIGRAREFTGSVDFLVNNASVYHRDDLAASDESKLLSELNVNFIAPTMLTRSLVSEHKSDARDGVVGKIVNILDSKIAGNEPGCLPYLMSKKMLAEFTKVSALELAPHYTVNGVAPGTVLPPVKSSGSKKDPAGAVPMGEQCGPDDVGAAVVFLLKSDFITGQTLFVDGGQHLL